MIPFIRRSDGVHLAMSPGERDVLTSLTEQLQQVLAGDVSADPVATRMFPDAYPGDAAASSEFGRLTRPDLLTQKTTNASVVHDWSTGVRDGALTPEDVQAWLRCLTDLRLTIAERLGITDAASEEASAADRSDRAVGLRDVYDWIGYVQEHLVDTISVP